MNFVYKLYLVPIYVCTYNHTMKCIRIYIHTCMCMYFGVIYVLCVHTQNVSTDSTPEEIICLIHRSDCGACISGEMS